MTQSTATLIGSAGQAPADGHPSHRDLPPRARRRSGVGQDEVAGAGREPVTTAVDSASSPPLPVRVPRTTWPAGVRRLSSKGRGHAVRPSSGRPGAAERTWTVVVLDPDGEPRETVTGFSSPESADGYAQLSPEIQWWRSVPSRRAVPDRIPD